MELLIKIIGEFFVASVAGESRHYYVSRLFFFLWLLPKVGAYKRKRKRKTRDREGRRINKKWGI